MHTKDFGLDTFSLAGKTALVTGGASGLGRYYTEALSAVGANILVISHSENGWSETKKWLNRMVRLSTS